MKDSNVWELRISAIRTGCDWKPKTGREKMAGPDVEVSTADVLAKVRPVMLDRLDVDTKYWEVYDPSDRSVWDIQAIIPSYRRGEFKELMLQRQM